MMHTPSMVSIAGARKVVIIFNSDNSANVELARKYYDYLSALGKKVSAIGYINAKDPSVNMTWWPGINYITRKELNWYFEPEKKIIDNFVGSGYDLLIDLNIAETTPLLFVTAMTPANCKVGKYTEQFLMLYDVMIETAPDKTLKYFLRNVDKYMENIDKGQKTPDPTQPLK